MAHLHDLTLGEPRVGDAAAVPGTAADVVRANREPRRVAQLLDRVLGSIASLTLRTQTTLWSVVDGDLWPLRDLLVDQQGQLDRRVDTVAGHMRALGAFPGGAFDGWQELVAIGDCFEEVRAGSAAARLAVHELVEEHERAARVVRSAHDALAATQPQTAELLAAIEHDLARMRWTLRSMAAALFAASRAVAPLEQVA